eukprot:gene4946-5264_t
MLTTTSDHFLCWNIDASRNRQFFDRDLDVSLPYGKQLAKQALAIGAGGKQLLRFGGGGNDALTYAFNGTECPPPPPPIMRQSGGSDVSSDGSSVGSTKDHECLNQTWWQNMLHFTEASGAEMIFGISEPKWEEQPPQVWNSKNAEQILQWTIDKGLELGNEVDGLYSGAEQAVNLQVLYNLTVKLWPEASKRPVLLGPDAAHQYIPDKSLGAPPTPRDLYVHDFFEAVGKMGFPVHGATLHKYIETSTARDVNGTFLDETTERFGVFKDQVLHGWADSGSTKAAPRLWGGEIGPHNGQSPPCNHSSMRWANYGDSLWYELVGHNVLSASISSSNQGQVRTYAHCTAPQAGATPGSITLIILNLDSIATSVSTSFGVGMISSSSNNEKRKRKGTATIFQLTPSNSAGLGSGVGVNGTVVQLNGKTLQLENSSGDVPELLSMGITHDAKNDVALPPQSITFVVYTSYDGAKASVCI